MLTTLAVAGYRSLRDVTVPLGALTVVTGPNGSGKSNLYRALRLLAQTARGELIGAVAREGGISSLLWAGPERGGTQGTLRKGPIAVLLGFASDDLGYLIDLGLPQVGQGSLFLRDPEIKRERVFTGASARPASVLVDRLRGVTRVRADGWVTLDQQLEPYESIVTDLADGDSAPELLALRRTMAGWRFYDHFRVDPEAPARLPQVGTRSPTLSHDGANVASVWGTLEEAGLAAPLDDAVADAFPGARVTVAAVDGLFRLQLHQRGLLRPLEATELSDGTLRYLLLGAALLPARPPPLIVLNEPESSLHPGLLAPLADLVAEAATRSQVVVVTHSAALAQALDDAGAHRVGLVADLTGTAVEGQGLLSIPEWLWGRR